jgi:S-adenosyl methyltransferase
MTETADVPPGVDPTTTSSARLYDYLLGGTNNFPVDRQVAEMMKAYAPDTVDAVLSNRGFHGRAAVWMARRGISQFLDLGSGLPTQNNTHESVRRVIPDARVVYVDIDPMVAAHASRLLEGDGSTALVTADLREPEVVLNHPDVLRLIDFDEPAGVLATDVIHFIGDSSDPPGLVARYMAAVAPGSFLALSHATRDNVPPPDRVMDVLEKAAVDIHLRPRAEVERFFRGLELVTPYEGAEPALTYPGMWGAEDPVVADTEGSRGFYCGVALRPAGFTA